MYDDSCDAILYADNKEYLRLSAQIQHMVAERKTDEMFSKITESLQYCGGNLKTEEIPEPIDPPTPTKRDNLEIRMKIEKIPFFEAVRLMGFKQAIRYQFKR